MSDDHIIPKHMREQMERFFKHVLGHDPDKLKFALMVAGHQEHAMADGVHVCTMIDGRPKDLAFAVTKIIDKLIAKDPHFAVFFMLQMLEKMQKLGHAKVKAVDLSKLDETGGDDIKKALDDALSQFQNPPTPPKGNLH